MQERRWSDILLDLHSRACPGGGFGNRPGGAFRPEATAWAVLALAAWGNDAALQERGRERLAAGQSPDGRVSLSPDHPETFWPTPLAILAWQSSAAQGAAQQRAVQFLLDTSGWHWKRSPGEKMGHDPEIRGWPWVAGTHSWAEPTALAVTALQAAGYGDHPRTAEARRMLLNRQLPGGGWNCGTVCVFDRVLYPLPESTGMVLNALGARADRGAVQESLGYLTGLVPRLNTPRTLAWALLGLGAWGYRPAAAPALLEACWARRDQFAGYDTVSLALLLVAYRAQGGLDSVLPLRRQDN